MPSCILRRTSCGLSFAHFAEKSVCFVCLLSLFSKEIHEDVSTLQHEHSSHFTAPLSERALAGRSGVGSCFAFALLSSFELSSSLVSFSTCLKKPEEASRDQRLIPSVCPKWSSKKSSPSRLRQRGRGGGCLRNYEYELESVLFNLAPRAHAIILKRKCRNNSFSSKSRYDFPL